MKKLISTLLAGVLMITAVGCNSSTGGSTEPSQAAASPGKIGIVTPSLSSSEDEYRAGENMVAKYPDRVKHISLPENEMVETETSISQITALADDPEMKAIVVVSGQSGLLPALQKVKEINPEIITLTAPIWDDPEMMSQYIDINLDTDWARRGITIVEKANEMGAKTFIHYSFPTHLAKESISKRKEMMKQTSEKLGMTFVEIVTPDPQTGDGPAAMQQFLREDIPRQIEKYGVDTNIFGSNCPMYDVIIDEALKLKFIVAEQCCPTPTQAFPTVMNLEIAKEDAGDFDKINEMIREKAAEADMTGRLSGWPIPATIFMPEYATELAIQMVDNNLTKEDVMNKEYLDNLGAEVFGVGVDFEPMRADIDNYYMMIMESIYY